MYRALSALLLTLTVASFAKVGGLAIACLIDLPSLILILGVVFGGIVFSFGPVLAWRVFIPLGLQEIAEDQSRRDLYSQALQRASHLSYAAGGLGFLIGAITILGDVSNPSMIGPGFAVALICPFYSVILSLLLFDGIRAGVESLSAGHPAAQLSV